MNKKLKIALLLLLLFGIVSIAGVFLFAEKIVVLSPKGMIGEKQRDLILVSTLIMLFVVVPVLLLLFGITWKYREDNKKAEYRPDWAHSNLAELVWWGVPFIIIVILSVITWRSCHELDPLKPIVMHKRPIKIQAVALQWKWLFIYPEQGIATLNYVAFPDQTPIDFEITADAPMNSFWIPELGGQIYAMPGMKSELHLVANGEGKYRGSSANLSGEGFSGMYFTAESGSDPDFDNWVDSVKASGKSLNIDEYNQLVEPSSYVPPAFYVLREPKLFEQIMMKYMTGMDHARVN